MKRRVEKAKNAALIQEAALNQKKLSNLLENQEEGENTVNFKDIWKMFKKKLWLVILLTVLFAGISGAISKFLLPPVYTSSSTVFLTPATSESGVIDYNSINSNQKLVNNVMKLMTQANILAEVSKDTGIHSQEDLKDILKITNEPNTELVTVSATTDDPKLSKEIVESTVTHFIDMMSANLNVSNIEITEKAKLTYTPSGPNTKRNALIGGIAGCAIALIIIIIQVLGDKRIKSKEDAEAFFGLPVYVELPKMNK